MFKFGDVVLVPFPFTDLTSTKVRPALVISKNDTPGDDVVLAFISSRDNAPGLRITSDLDVFDQTGLKVTSVIRYDKIATLEKKLVLGELGYVPVEFLREHKQKFLDNFGF